MERAYIGTVENVVFTFRIAATNAVEDPTTVTIEVKAPTATKVTYTYLAQGSPIVRRSKGVYVLPVTYTESNTDIPWMFIGHGVGAGFPEGTQQGARYVSPRLFP